MTTTSTTTAIGRVRVVRVLMTCGLLAGPVYVGTSFAEALTRPGFDLTRHSWSVLANGDLGWIHITNLVLTGALLVAFGIGLRRALRGGRGGAAAPVLVAAFGLSMIVAGLFRADPAPGFPIGTPDGPVPVSVHGLVHFAAGAVGFAGIAAACLVLGARYAAERRTAWAWLSRVTGVVFFVAFAGLASSGGSPAGIVGFVIAIVLLFTWITAVAADILRTSAV